MFADSLSSLTLWISSALYGGYAAANVLKWIWWRFNGYGYFAGMLAGLLSATFVPKLMAALSKNYFTEYKELFGSGIGTLISFFYHPRFIHVGQRNRLPPYAHTR
ncbi:hypothetical protein [Paraflavitalea speifideaquila]|uniref:hypothetical protein n=1 Tax=Paraflavitalea speifideaquila TaxID=3076558 RepID=UPI0028F09E14|nr:hypothetical protein [Paraflavitalea speifideiaquila]